MAPVAEAQAILAHAHELVQGGFCGVLPLRRLPELVESQWVKFVGVRVDIRVEVDGDGGDFDSDASRYDLAVGKLQGFQNLALERSYTPVTLAV